MPSIRPRPGLRLTLRRADVAAFWIVSTVTAAIVCGVTAAVAGSTVPWLWAATAVVLPAPGAIWPAWFVFGVRGWNRVTPLCANALRAYVLRVVYYTVFAGAAAAGSSLALASDGGKSRWIRRSARPPAREDLRGIAGGLMDAARRPGSRWMVCLLPVVAVLRILGDEAADTAPSSSTYTLY